MKKNEVENDDWLPAVPIDWSKIEDLLSYRFAKQALVKKLIVEAFDAGFYQGRNVTAMPSYNKGEDYYEAILSILKQAEE